MHWYTLCLHHKDIIYWLIDWLYFFNKCSLHSCRAVTVCAVAQSCCLPTQETFCCFHGWTVTGSLCTEQGDGLAQDKSAPCQQCLSSQCRPGHFCFTLSDTACPCVYGTYLCTTERNWWSALIWSTPIPHTGAHYTRTQGHVFNISKISIIPPNWYPYLLNWSISFTPTPYA